MSYPIAYSYNGELFCTDHVVQAIDGQAEVQNFEDGVEAKLDYLAVVLCINRRDENTFGENEFPKPFLLNNPGTDDVLKSTCDICHQTIADTL